MHNEKTDILEPDFELAQRIEVCVGKFSYQELSRRTGYHPESVRRYLQSGRRIPADFVGKIANSYETDAHFLLLGEHYQVDDKNLKMVQTRFLLIELAKRFLMIEDSVVGFESFLQILQEDKD